MCVTCKYDRVNLLRLGDFLGLHLRATASVPLRTMADQVYRVSGSQLG
jgi:hypothetical protein